MQELTPEQLYELCCYHAVEPFGEVREDLRMANLLCTYVASKAGKRGRKFTLGEFVMYQDIRDDATDPAGVSALLRATGG
jgi:hypothetical protein